MGLLGKDHWTHSESPFVSHRQRKLCKEKPSPRVPSGTSPRPGWRRLARPYRSQFPNWPTNARTPNPKNCSAQQSLSARLFPHSRLEETGGPDASPSGGPQLSLRSMQSLPGVQPEKTSFGRAPTKSCSNAYSAFERFRYFRRGARVPLDTRKLSFARQNPLAPTRLSKKPSLTARLGKSFPINSPFIGLISS